MAAQMPPFTTTNYQQKIAPTGVVIPFFVGLLRRWQNGI